jgi:hypothetical protein
VILRGGTEPRTFALCVATMRQQVRPQPEPPTEPTESYRTEKVVRKNVAGKEFRVLAIACSVPIVKHPIAGLAPYSTDRCFGQTDRSIVRKPAPRRGHKEPADCIYAGKPSPQTPMERKGWSPPAEVEGGAVGATERMERAWFDRLTPEQIQQMRARRYRDPRERRLVRLGGVDPADDPMPARAELAGRKRKPDLRKRSTMESLMVRAFGLAQRGHAQQEIAAKLGVTRSQVRTLLLRSEKIIVAVESTS